MTRAVPWLAAALAAGTVAAGLWLDASGHPLGVPYPPFTGQWSPRLDPLAAAALAVFAGAVLVAPRLTRPAISPTAFCLAVLGLTLVLRLALAAGRAGTGAWTAVFDVDASFEAGNEYLPALNALAYGPGFFVDRFAELVPALPVHAAGHPPGLLVLLDAAHLDTPGKLAALCIAAGAPAAPLTYLTGRRLLDESTARIAALLAAFAPGALQFGATSADAVYLALGLLAAWPLAAAGRALRLLGAGVLALGSFFAWSLPAVGAWAAVVALRRHGLRSAAELVIVCGIVLLGAQGAVAALTGFDPIGTLQSTEQVYRLGVASTRPYAFWVAGSPTAFLLVLGLPIAWLAVRALAEGDDLALAIFAVIAASAVLGFTKAETERIWLFLAPYVCLAAATRLRPGPILTVVLAGLAIQALAWEALWNTIW
jgi:hypothetical protein